MFQRDERVQQTAGRRPAAWTLLLAGMAAACAEPWPDPPPVEETVLAAEHELWRGGRRTSLANPDAGVVSWIGLWELAEGPNAFGSDPAFDIVLPVQDSPPHAGTLHLEQGQVRLEPEPESGMALRMGDPITESLPMNDDRSGETTIVELGSLGFRIHAERGTSRLWLRVWDRDDPRLAAFELPEYFPVSNAWRLAARFEPFPEPRSVPLADVTGGMVANEAPGELVFRADGRDHRLMVFATESSSSYFVTLWDSTGVSDTYQGGRYMRVPLADEEGWTTIDFNRAYNPPCVFTPYSVCSLPPRENRLQLPVTAGEKRPPMVATRAPAG